MKIPKVIASSILNKLVKKTDQLSEDVSKINSDLCGFTPVIDETGKITGYKTTVGGADTVFPFSPGGVLILSVAYWTSLTGCSYSSEYLEQTDWANYKVLKSCKGIAICNGFGITSTGGGGSYQVSSGKGNGTTYNPAPIYYFELFEGDSFYIGNNTGSSIQLFSGCDYGF